MKSKNHVIFFDCAYQGFASGDSEVDAYAIRKFVDDGHLIILSQSFAKNFGLYGERVGTLAVVGSNVEETERLSSQVLNYSRIIITYLIY
jgi:aspartate aminotransferase